MIDLILDKALEKCGSSKVLAGELEISPSELTRFRSGENGMKMEKVSKLIEISGMILIEKDQEEKLINAALTFADLYKNKR